MRGLSLVLAPGEMRAIIGPNGAGKTTMMDVITGKTRPDEGDVLFDGRHDLTRLDEAEIASLGIGRKFQKPTVFENHTVEDNLLLATKAPRSVLATLFGREDKAVRQTIDRILATTRLSDQRARVAGSLSHGQKQWLEIGMLLAQDPKLLLVDEPVAGMTDAETFATAELLREIARDHSVVVVEHDMAFVRELGVKVTVLHEGSVLADGSLDTGERRPARRSKSIWGGERATPCSPLAGRGAGGDGGCAGHPVQRRDRSSRRRRASHRSPAIRGHDAGSSPLARRRIGGPPMLTVDRIDLFYGAAQALRSVSLKAETGRHPDRARPQRRRQVVAVARHRRPAHDRPRARSAGTTRT